LEYDLSNPYSYLYHAETGYYTFKTGNGLVYQVYFTDGSGYFEAYPEIAPYFFMFGFLVLDSKEALPDESVWATIYHILVDVFANSNKVLLFVCDTKDDKQAQRHRLFSVWYNCLPTVDRKEVKKFDMILESEDMKLFSSLLISKQHIEYEAIVKAFLDLQQHYQEKLSS
jgi:hypothetical protein